MKKVLSVLALMLALTSVCQASGQRHRHHPQAIGLTQTIDSGSTALPSDTAGIDAFSDTTSTTTSTPQTTNDDFDDDEFFSHMGNWGFFDGIGPILGACLAAVICLAPFVLMGFIVWIIFRNRNQRYRLAEKAMERGQPIPDDLLSAKQITDDILWRKAIRNIFLGIGLAIFFACWHSTFLMGIGWLLCFYGIGQAVICKTTKKKDNDNNGPIE